MRVDCALGYANGKDSKSGFFLGLGSLSSQTWPFLTTCIHARDHLAPGMLLVITHTNEDTSPRTNKPISPSIRMRDVMTIAHSFTRRCLPGYKNLEPPSWKDPAVIGAPFSPEEARSLARLPGSRGLFAGPISPTSKPRLLLSSLLLLTVSRCSWTILGISCETPDDGDAQRHHRPGTPIFPTDSKRSLLAEGPK